MLGKGGKILRVSTNNDTLKIQLDDLFAEEDLFAHRLEQLDLPNAVGGA